MSLAECPYCDADVEICHDDGYGYDGSRPHNQACSECGKTFVYHTSIHYHYQTEQAPCMNGGQHQFKRRPVWGGNGRIEVDECASCELRVPAESAPKPAGGDACPHCGGPMKTSCINCGDGQVQ